MRSSYTQNNFGQLLEEYVKSPTWQPSSFVELGVLDGYSTLHIARGIEWLHKNRGFKPPFDAYDLFEDYQFKHGKKDEVEKVLSENNLLDYVNLQSGDAYKVHSNYPEITYDSEGDPG